MKNPYEHYEGPSGPCGECQACAWEAGVRAGVELAKKHVTEIRDPFYEYLGLDWSDVDFELERKE